MTRALLCAMLAVSASTAATGAEARDPVAADLLGASIRLRPAFDGADTRVVDAVPVFSFERRFGLLRSTQGLAEAALLLRPLPSLKVGALLALEEPADYGEVDALARRGLDDGDPSASIGPFVELDFRLGPVPLNALARWRQDLDADRGAQADLRLTIGFYGSARTRLGSFVQLTWADQDSMRFEYGVDGATAARTGLSRYAPSSGTRHLGFGLIGQHDLSSRWSLVGSVELRLLGDGPDDSPLSSESRVLRGTLGAAYRF